jgi:sulfofructose kinase
VIASVRKSPQVDVVGVGLNATDTIIYLPDFPAPGSKLAFNTASTLPGGQVATALVACQSWGIRTRYVGKLGDDHAAKVHLEQFAASGVEAQVTTVPGCASAQSFILVDPQGERTVLWRKDERLELHEADLKHEWIVNARVLHVDGSDTAAAIAAANWARSAGIPTIADLDEVYSGLDALLELIDYLIVSRHFPSQLLGENDLRKSLPLLQSRFGSTLTAATLGNAGVLAWDGQKFHSACAYRVPVVDTTGAGDIFHAGFIYGLLQGWAVQRQLEFACAAAALNCMAHGARGGVRPITEIEDLMTRGPRYPVAFDTVVGSL